MLSNDRTFISLLSRMIGAMDALTEHVEAMPLEDRQPAKNLARAAIDMAVSELDQTSCEHQWVDARNEHVESGELCLKCGAIRAAHGHVAGTVGSPRRAS